MIDDAALERGLRARPPADPTYRSRIVETPPTGIRPRLTRVRPTQPGTTRSMLNATRMIVVVAIVSLGAILVATGGGPGDLAPVASEAPSEPAAIRVVCGNHDGTWSLSLTPAAPGRLGSEVLGCSADGTRVLVQKGGENLFVVHADGTETQVTDQLTGFNTILGSSRPSGATISPDGSRVVFAGLTARGRSCHDGALFGVDADGGPAWLLWESQVPQNGIVRDPTFSPDGTQIAFADGYCDHDHSVWVMNADGSDAHQIVPIGGEELGATHVHGLAWSPAGDRIAVGVDQGTYSFAGDGSDFKNDAARGYCWPGRQC